MKEFLPESDFVYGYVQYYVTQVRNFDTCLSKSEKKIQIFAKNTNIHLHSSSLFHENEKWLNFIRVNRF